MVISLSMISMLIGEYSVSVIYHCSICCVHVVTKVVLKIWHAPLIGHLYQIMEIGFNNYSYALVMLLDEAQLHIFFCMCAQFLEIQ